MLAHAGGAATIDAPVWLLAYGAAAAVLLITVTLRGRMVVAAAAGDGVVAGAQVVAAQRHVPRAVVIVGHVLGVGLLAVVVAAALVGPAASAANLAPSAVLTVWWVGLPLACVVAGDVMAWLDPFGTLARPLARAGGDRPAPAWTAAALLATWTWWVLAFHDGRSPRSLGWFLVAYTAVAVGGAVVWGRRWLRHGEGFGALASALAGTGAAALGLLVAVWSGAVAFDLFSGTRAWVDLAGGSSGWERTAWATACLAAAIVLAWLVVEATGRLARAREAAAIGWLATTAGLFVGHGIPGLLLDGQFALALASDPVGRGWDLFGTARRTIDYSPLSPGLVGALQLVAAAGGAAWGVMAAARSLRAGSAPAPAPAAQRALWVIGAILATAAAAGVAVLAADLE